MDRQLRDQTNGPWTEQCPPHTGSNPHACLNLLLLKAEKKECLQGHWCRHRQMSVLCSLIMGLYLVPHNGTGPASNNVALIRRATLGSRQRGRTLTLSLQGLVQKHSDLGENTQANSVLCLTKQGLVKIIHHTSLSVVWCCLLCLFLSSVKWKKKKYITASQNKRSKAPNFEKVKKFIILSCTSTSSKIYYGRQLH